MIFITGDVHSDINDLVMRVQQRPEYSEMTKDDVFIICGDFGMIWHNPLYYPEAHEFEQHKIDIIEDLPCTVVFIDGNHENFDKLYTYPVKEWNGGKVHEIRPHIFHLMRGEVFNIEGIKFLAFGGAHCHDISGGVLSLEDPDFEKKYTELDRQRALFRVNKISWWEQECPNNKEFLNAMNNVEKYEDIDYLITHDCAASEKHYVHWDVADDVNLMIEALKANIKNLKHHYFGHYHMNRRFASDKCTVLYDRVESIS